LAKYLYISILITLILAGSASSFAQGNGNGPLHANIGLKNQKPAYMDKIGIDEHLGDTVDLSLPFVDDHGKQVLLGDYFGKKPVFLMLIYYNCPTLCSSHLNALMDTFKELEYKIGNEFDFVAISIDPEESSQLAKMKKAAYLESYGKPETKDGWHFLTGNQKSITKIASQVGFKYAWDYKMEQWAHSAAAYVLTPEGKISFYHYGLMVNAKTLKLSLVEASNNKIGTVMERLVLFCLQYDPDKKTYAFYAYNIMRVGAFFTVLILGFFLFRFWRKQESGES